MADLAVSAFLALRKRFFDPACRPVPFTLRPKQNTQDDPFDELLATDVLARIPGIRCAKASGPLITPDMVLFRPEQCERVDSSLLVDALDRIVCIEVKKLERTAQGGVARASGLDYNTTPPCGKARVYDAASRPVDVRGFYLFVCLESYEANRSQVVLTALALVDGNLLNADFELYLSIVGEREKRINLGSYADGADRARPMLIFSNPIGVPQLAEAPTLVHPSERLEVGDDGLRRVFEIRRTVPSHEEKSSFFAYRVAGDVPSIWRESVLEDPFPTPKRDVRTRPRGRFRLPFRV